MATATDTFNSGETLTFTGANGSLTTAVTDNTSYDLLEHAGTVSGSETQIEDVIRLLW